MSIRTPGLTRLKPSKFRNPAPAPTSCEWCKVAGCGDASFAIPPLLPPPPRVALWLHRFHNRHESPPPLLPMSSTLTPSHCGPLHPTYHSLTSPLHPAWRPGPIWREVWSSCPQWWASATWRYADSWDGWRAQWRATVPSAMSVIPQLLPYAPYLILPLRPLS